MRIAEVFASWQGEGLLTGVPSLFIRTSGCNLRCWFCDTPYTSWDPQGDDLSLEEILTEVDRHALEHVVLTGGEPLLWAELVPLAAALRARGCHITIETAGTLYQELECDLLSLSPKFASSAPAADEHPLWHDRHERARHAPDVVARLLDRYSYQLKFVIDTPDDCAAAEGYLAQLNNWDPQRVLFMPQGTNVESLAEREAWLLPLCAERGYRYCPRRQIEWFGNRRGT